MKKSNIFLYPLSNKVVYPYHEYQLSLNSNQYDSKQYDNFIGFVTKIQAGQSLSSKVERTDGISKYGTLMKIYRESSSDFTVNEKIRISKLNLIGLTFARFRVISTTKKDTFYIATVEILDDDIPKPVQAAIEKKKLFDILKTELKLFYDCTMRLQESEARKAKLDPQKSVNKVVFTAMSFIQASVDQKLQFLQINDAEARINYLLTRITSKTQNLKNIKGIEDKVRQELTRSSQSSSRSLETTKSGSKNGKLDDLQRIRKRMDEKDLPAHVREQIEKELDSMDSSSQTKNVTIKYLETVLDVPWNESTEDRKDIKIAEEILNNQHTGLEKVKERILQFLAVRFRNGNSKGNILCLHGPPGVGKTSIAKSIAQALGRKFTRISLGGVTDEAEIRGHRRTYVAALPGVIVRTLIKAKSNNPVILLDEIQKMGRSYKGDPANALLEVLDPNQNTSFVDHYLSIPIDLSKVMFICTANDIEELSIPLLNRLETIHIEGYTKEEKFSIAVKNIIPEQKLENGVQQLVSFEDDAVYEIIKYSHEMGVRQLGRDVAKICRKVAFKGVPEKITPKRVQQILGDRKEQNLWGGVGVVKGMAWTSQGGKILIVEAIKSVGKGKIEITGQLGDIMKESCKIALSWIKSNFTNLLSQGQNKDLMVNPSDALDELEKTDIHIHFPAGAIKKDGPSAGVTIVTCLVSLLTGLRPKESLAMTGEISLSGQVLPVGGIKQKCLAAITKGIKEIIIPKGNAGDIKEIPEQYKKEVVFHTVSNLKQVLGIALTNNRDTIKPAL